MSIHLQTMLRGLLLVILAVGASQPASAHDWPLRVDASERFLTNVRMQPAPKLPEAPNSAYSFLPNIEVAKLASVLRSSMNQGVDLAKYLAVPSRLFSDLSPDNHLAVSSPIDRPAPLPPGRGRLQVVHAEHCLGEEYRPYDFNAEDNCTVADDRDISQDEKMVIARSIKVVLRNANRWQCEFVDSLHSAKFATNVGHNVSNVSLRLVQSSHALASSAVSRWQPRNLTTLPKYTYVETRSGTILAPAHLAQKWNTNAQHPVSQRVPLLVQSGNGLRSAVSKQLENVAQSLLSVARFVAPDSNGRMAIRTGVEQR